MKGRYVLVLLVGLLGWGALELMQWQAGLGRFAESPQRMEIRKGVTALVAGGQAGVVFLDSPFRRRAQMKVRCKDVDQSFDLGRGDVSEEICGIRVRLLEILPGDRVAIEATWGEDGVEPPAPGTDGPEPSGQ
ncbi:MAG: hypothetical protein AAGN66_25435 [Acidobacteriota bacterium]